MCPKLDAGPGPAYRWTLSEESLQGRGSVVSQPYPSRCPSLMQFCLGRGRLPGSFIRPRVTPEWDLPVSFADSLPVLPSGNADETYEDPVHTEGGSQKGNIPGRKRGGTHRSGTSSSNCKTQLQRTRKRLDIEGIQWSEKNMGRCGLRHGFRRCNCASDTRVSP